MACDGEIRIEGSGEFETKFSSKQLVVLNGDTIRNEENSSKKHGGGEFEVNIDLDDKNSKNDSLKLNAEEDFNLKHRINCTAGVSASRFENLKEQILDEHMDKAKSHKAKLLFNDNCISSAQVRDLINLLMMDKYKLDFAKFAYGRTTDRINYNKVLVAFKFDKTREHLIEYINEQ